MAGPDSTLHVHLRDWRKSRRLTLERLANMIGSKVNTISGWENGKRTVDLDDLQKLADAYGVHPTLLLHAPPGTQELLRLQEAAQLLATMTPEDAAEWLHLGSRFAKPQNGPSGTNSA
jgi:transcriptional regulator with XRE-family HTH domain